MAVEGRPEALGMDVRVDFGRPDAGMAQENLHGPKVGPPLDQMGGEGMPDPVGVHGLSEAGPAGPMPKPLPDGDPREGPPPAVEENGRFPGRWGPARPYRRQIGLQMGSGLPPDGEPANPTALAPAQETAFREVQVVQAETDQLGDPETRRIQ
jgi:hypothetical protein